MDLNSENATLRQALEDRQLTRRAALAQAYKNTQHRRVLDHEEEEARRQERIKPLKRVAAKDTGKFDHAPGFYMSGKNGSPPKIQVKIPLN